MNINLEFDAKALAAPASFRAAVQQAATVLDAALIQNVTINIEVGYGEDPLSGALSPQSSADGGPAGGRNISYSSLRSDLIANATAGDTTFNSLPVGSSVQGQSQVIVWDAQLKALGLEPANNSIDGSIGIGTQVPQADLVGVALHELTHAMGRVENAPQPDIMDFFRFTSPGNLLPFNDSIPGPTSYFSVNNGVTALAKFGQSSDPSDFLNAPASNLTPTDSFNEYYDTGTLQNLTVPDLKMLDALGFDVSPSLLTFTLPTMISLSGVSDSSASPVVSGHVVTITVDLNEAVTVEGAPTLLLNDNEVASYTSGSGTSTLTFSYVVQTGDVTSDLKVTGLDLQGGNASITDSNGDALTTVTGDLGLNIHGYPEATGNVSEWILSNGQLTATAGPGSHPTGSQVVVLAISPAMAPATSSGSIRAPGMSIFGRWLTLGGTVVLIWGPIRVPGGRSPEPAISPATAPMISSGQTPALARYKPISGNCRTASGPLASAQAPILPVTNSRALATSPVTVPAIFYGLIQRRAMSTSGRSRLANGPAVSIWVLIPAPAGRLQESVTSPAMAPATSFGPIQAAAKFRPTFGSCKMANGSQVSVLARIPPAIRSLPLAILQATVRAESLGLTPVPAMSTSGRFLAGNGPAALIWVFILRVPAGRS